MKSKSYVAAATVVVATAAGAWIVERGPEPRVVAETQTVGPVAGAASAGVCRHVVAPLPPAKGVHPAPAHSASFRGLSAYNIQSPPRRPALDCRRNPGCRDYGHCTSTSMGCVRLSSDDCAQTKECLERGHCSLDRPPGSTEGSCRACRPQDCSQAVMCQQLGRCSPDGGSCVAKRTADCRKAQICSEHGRCKAAGGECVATAQGCQRSLACQQEGHCTVRGRACGPR
ncbi:MAG: hypothetical protein AAGA56_05240 [Myxococcota bacterium]